MQRQRDGLVPIGEALADLPGPVQRSVKPRPRRGPTRRTSLSDSGPRGRIDPVALEARDCTHDRPTASRGVAPGSPRSDRTRAGCFRWRRDDVPWQSLKPTSERTTKPGKFRRGPPADAVRALRPARATGQRQSVVPEMPPVPQEGPLTRPGATNAGPGHLFPTSHRRSEEQASRAV